MKAFTRRAAFLLPVAAPAAMMARPIPAAAQDREILELGARFDVALAEQKRLDALAELGGAAQAEEAMTAWRLTGDVVDAIRQSQPRTIRGVQVKCRAALLWSAPDERDWDPVALSAVKDLLKLSG